MAPCMEVSIEDWRHDFINYLKHGRWPEESHKRTQLRRRLLQYLYFNDTLYRKSYDQLWLRCLSSDEAKQAMYFVHSGVCGAHQSGPKMRVKLKQMGYYWPTMVQDCMDYAKRCHICKIHGDYIKTMPKPLHPTVASWPIFLIC